MPHNSLSGVIRSSSEAGFSEIRAVSSSAESWSTRVLGRESYISWPFDIRAPRCSARIRSYRNLDPTPRSNYKRSEDAPGMARQMPVGSIRSSELLLATGSHGLKKERTRGRRGAPAGRFWRSEVISSRCLGGWSVGWKSDPSPELCPSE